MRGCRSETESGTVAVAEREDGTAADVVTGSVDSE